MNKKIVPVLLLVVLATLIYLGYNRYQDSESSEATAYSDFAVEDTSKVVKFRISDTETNEITITKENGVWMIEGSEFKAQRSLVTTCLDAFKRAKVKQDLPDSQRQQVLSTMMVRHKKIEIYMEGDSEPSKSWIIGSNTTDRLGTYMVLQKGKQKSSMPYIVEKAGMSGTLDVRFVTDFKLWRSSQVFGHDPKEIEQIKIDFNLEPEKSYTAYRQGELVGLKNGEGIEMTSFDSSQVKHYFTHYRNVHYNQVYNDINKEEYDSILNLNPDFEIAVTAHGETKEINMWRIKMPEGKVDAQFNPVIWDPEYAIIQIGAEPELFRIQFYSWDVLFKPLPFYNPVL